MFDDPGPLISALVAGVSRSSGRRRPESFYDQLERLWGALQAKPGLVLALDPLLAEVRSSGWMTVEMWQRLSDLLTLHLGPDPELADLVADRVKPLTAYLRSEADADRTLDSSSGGAGRASAPPDPTPRSQLTGPVQPPSPAGSAQPIRPGQGAPAGDRGARSWQDELRSLDADLAEGRISADDYRARRDTVLAPLTRSEPPAQAEPAPMPAEQPSGDTTGQHRSGESADDPPLAGIPFPAPDQSSDWDDAAKLRPPWRRLLDLLRSGPADAEPTDTRAMAAPAVRRHLVAHLPSRSPLDTDVSLVVRIGSVSGGWSASAPLAPLAVPEGGTWVTVLVQAPPGLAASEALEQSVLVPAAGDSAPVRFGFHAIRPGLHRVRVMAFAGGTFLAELQAEVSVEPGGPAVDGRPVVAAVDEVSARQGEVTLQVRSEGNRTIFQLLSESYLFEPVPAEATAADPAMAVERAIATLRQLATGRGPYGSGTARRWMQETGIGLWDQMVPGVIKDQYWQLREQITSFTIATSHDVIPWELLYPLRPGSDDGFLVEQFPVLRRVFDQRRRDRVTIAPCTYVVSGRSPTNTRAEIDTIAEVLGNAGVVDDLNALLDLIGSGTCGPLHFVCHNSFSSDSGSSIAMNGGPFVPPLLNSAAVRRSLAASSPLVFVNACRTAGVAPEYRTMTGWAQQFMAAGAGAFVGTLWPVRSESASAFARTFYGLLRDGESLGDAALAARSAAVHDGPDPTWLAYTVYGDPYAHAAG